MPDDEIRAAIESASRYLTDHPAEARYTDSGATVVMESGLRFRAEFPGGTIATDMPGSVGGDILKAVAVACAPLMKPDTGGSVVGLDFDASVAWPGYDWMGVAKAGLESCARYLARDLGEKRVRVNLVAAGPLRTMAAKSIPGFDRFEGVWGTRAPLGWNITDPEPTARACVALLSDWFPATTGEIVHVDGGVHAVGA